MTISIITSVYNNKETIAEAIESVLSQTYEALGKGIRPETVYLLALE